MSINPIILLLPTSLSRSSGGPEEQERRKAAFSVMQFLQRQIKSGHHSPDSVESLGGLAQL